MRRRTAETMSKITVSLSPAHINMLDLMADRLNRSRSSVVQDILTKSFENITPESLDRHLPPPGATKRLSRPSPGRRRRQIGPKHEAQFRLKPGRPPREGKTRFGYPACVCGWTTDVLASEKMALSRAATHVRHQTGG